MTPKLTLDAGGRYESTTYNIYNQQYNAATSPTNTTDPLNLYNANIESIGAVLPVRRSYHYVNYSFSAAYQTSNNFDAYVRYTYAQKAPDFTTIEAINTPGLIATDFVKPQGIQQIEMGLKYHHGALNLQLFPFYSRLSNVTTPQSFTYASGPQKGQFYTPVPVAGEITTYGVEMALYARITPTLSTRGNLTLQNPRSKNFGTYTQGPKGDGTDDFVTLVPAGDADNNPKIIVRAGLDWSPVHNVKFFGDVNYLGRRAANEYDAFYLPGFATLDVGGSVDVTSNLKLQLNVTNLTNALGVMSWSQSGGILASINRQGLYPQNSPANLTPQYSPGGLYPIVPTQPRAIFLAAKLKF